MKFYNIWYELIDKNYNMYRIYDPIITGRYLRLQQREYESWEQHISRVTNTQVPWERIAVIGHKCGLTPQETVKCLDCLVDKGFIEFSKASQK